MSIAGTCGAKFKHMFLVSKTLFWLPKEERFLNFSFNHPEFIIGWSYEAKCNKITFIGNTFMFAPEEQGHRIYLEVSW